MLYVQHTAHRSPNAPTTERTADMKLPTLRTIRNTTLVNAATSEQLDEVQALIERTLVVEAVTTEDEAAKAKELLSSIATAASTLEKNRTRLKKEWLDGGKAVDAAFKTLTVPLGKATSFLKTECGKWVAECRRKADELAMEQAQAAALPDTSEGLPAEIKQENVQAIPATVMKTRKHKTVKILDESKIPREYFDLNTSRLRTAILEGKLVPGAELVEEDIIVS